MIHKFLVGVIYTALLLTIPVCAQESVDRAMIAKIRDEGLNRSQALKIFTQFTEVIGPRLTGSPQVKAASMYGKTRLAEWGLENPRLEAWEFGRGWSLEKFSVEMIEPRYAPLVGYPEAWSASTAGELIGTHVLLGDKSAAA
ncbi:MAG TPA: hypothetical protein VJV05_15930, partial [Pyrinomonadaceae bacterium]|nr:hypothetical protein [Pyrinomonadaceae bacterium]